MNLSRKVIIFVVWGFSACFCPQIFASKVRTHDSTAPLAYAGNVSDPSIGMIIDRPSSGEGETEALPFIIYIPLGSGATQEACTIVSSGTSLPEPPNGVGEVKVRLSLFNDSGSTQTLFAAVKDGSSYEVINLTSGTSIASDASSSQIFSVIFGLDAMCANQASPTCTTIDSSATDGGREGEYQLYIFLDANAHAAGDVITPQTGVGLYLKLKVSDKLPSGVQTLGKLRRGDGRLTAELSGGSSITQLGSILYKSQVFAYSGTTPVTSNQCPGSASGTTHVIDTATLSGDMSVKSLTNGTSYNLAFGLVNKYQFTTLLSNSLVATPETIEALLKKQACFLITAGFGREHYVLDYFRAFRDQVLVKHSATRGLVILYYYFGHRLAYKVLDHPHIATLIRAMAYFIYFVMTRFAWIASCFIIAFSFIALKKRKAVKLGQT